MAQASLTRIEAVELRSAIRAIERRAGASRVSAEVIEQQVVQTVRAVRSGRARKRR